MLQHTIKNILRSERFNTLVEQALIVNPIFTRQSIQTAVQAIEEQFLTASIDETQLSSNPIKVGVICAGNIPLVGFADVFHALRTGSEVYIKPSTRDPLMQIFDPLCNIVDVIPQDVDILLAMGSDQTMQTLRNHYPHTEMVLRGERHSVAVIDGNESGEELGKLGNDMFLHAAMGCRSVVHIFVPQGFQIDRLSFATRSDLPQIWYDNYKYQRAVRSMRGEKFIDGGFFLLSQTDLYPTIAPPQTVVNYSFYTTPFQIELPDQKIQCVVARSTFAHSARVDFGRAQFPSITDHADGIDVAEIISKKKLSLPFVLRNCRK